jgi:hypothetical protein
MAAKAAAPTLAGQRHVTCCGLPSTSHSVQPASPRCCSSSVDDLLEIVLIGQQMRRAIPDDDQLAAPDRLTPVRQPPHRRARAPVRAAGAACRRPLWRTSSAERLSAGHRRVRRTSGTKGGAAVRDAGRALRGRQRRGFEGVVGVGRQVEATAGGDGEERRLQTVGCGGFRGVAPGACR